MKYSLHVAVALVLLSASTAAADPIALVTSGAIVFTDEPTAFAIAGSGFNVGFEWAFRTVSGPSFGNTKCASGCVPGTAIDFGTSTYAFSERFQGFGGRVNGVAYSQLFSTGQVTFEGPQIVAPSFNEGFPQGAFTFHGTVGLFTDPSRTGPAVFARELRGRGIAIARGHLPRSPSDLFSFDSGDDLVYLFTSPVPEPASFGLLGIGLLGMAGLRWWRAEA